MWHVRCECFQQRRVISSGGGCCNQCAGGVPGASPSVPSGGQCNSHKGSTRRCQLRGGPGDSRRAHQGPQPRSDRSTSRPAPGSLQTVEGRPLPGHVRQPHATPATGALCMTSASMDGVSRRERVTACRRMVPTRAPRDERDPHSAVPHSSALQRPPAAGGEVLVLNYTSIFSNSKYYINYFPFLAAVVHNFPISSEGKKLIEVD